MSEEEFRKIAKEYAEMYFTKGINSTKIFYYVDELEKKVEQLENIRKEAIKTIEEDILGKKIENVNWDYDECYYSDMPVERVKHLLNILNKGSEE